jgi:hypothetical protein
LRLKTSPYGHRNIAIGIAGNFEAEDHPTGIAIRMLGNFEAEDQVE